MHPPDRLVNYIGLKTPMPLPMVLAAVSHVSCQPRWLW